MKLYQTEPTFTAVHLVLETREDAVAFWDMAEAAAKALVPAESKRLAIAISNWFSSEAHL